MAKTVTWPTPGQILWGDVHFGFEAPRYSIATDQVEYLR